MKTTVLAIAATFFASSAAMANDALFDVNDAPVGYNIESVQMLDTEATASTNPAGAIDLDFNSFENDQLFDN